MEKTRKWRWGTNRWIILGLSILGIIGVNLIGPVQPHIQVAAENLSSKPLFTLPVVGDFYLTNTLIAMVFMDIVIIGIALLIRSAAKKNELAPKGIAGVFEMLLEVLYNMTESTAGKYAKKIFPWFATILIVVLFANLLKLIPGFETIGLIASQRTWICYPGFGRELVHSSEYEGGRKAGTSSPPLFADFPLI